VLKLRAPEVPDFQSVLLKLDKKKKKKDIGYVWIFKITMNLPKMMRKVSVL